MCEYTPTPKAEQKLADLMATDLGVTISPEALRLFLLARWKRVTCLAHSIHDSGECA